MKQLSAITRRQLAQINKSLKEARAACMEQKWGTAANALGNVAELAKSMAERFNRYHGSRMESKL